MTDGNAREGNKKNQELKPNEKTEVSNGVMNEILTELRLAREERARMEKGIDGIKATVNNMKTEVKT